MNRLRAFIFTGIGGLHSLFIIISMASAGWLIASATNQQIKISLAIGIWEGGSGDAALNAVRAFMLFGLFAQIGAAIICLMVALEKTDKWLIASILFFASGICLLIAMSTYTGSTANPASDESVRLTYRYGHSFALGWVACVLSLLAAVAIVVVERFSSNQG